VAIDCKASGFSSAEYLISEFDGHGINIARIDNNTVALSMNETTTIQDLTDLIEIFATLNDNS